VKPPRFFCNNCGTEVASGENRCPECGRYFSSVKCPRCGFSGEEQLFRDGCPVCFYPSSKSAAPGKAHGKPAPPKQGKSNIDFLLYAAFTAFLIFAIVLLFFL